LAGMVVAIVLISFVAYEILNAPGDVTLPNPPSHFTVNGHTFTLTYIATDEHSREVGLMNKAITNTTTMLFVFPSPGYYAFWMSGVNSSLDIIWLSMNGDRGSAVYIANDVPACNASVLSPNYMPTASASWVLEVQGGFCNKYGVTAGSEIQFN